MRTENLIKLGAFAQHHYNLKQDFEIQFIPYRNERIARIVVPPHPGWLRDHINPRGEVLIDEVILEKVGTGRIDEFAWIGYAPRANVLAVMRLP